MGYGLSFWPIPVMAAIQSEIAASFDTPTEYIWFIPSWSLAITVCFMIAYVSCLPLDEHPPLHISTQSTIVYLD